MKKRLEAELISIAHRILKLKNKSELNQLYTESRKLYETLSVLKFVEDNVHTIQPPISEFEIEKMIENDSLKSNVEDSFELDHEAFSDIQSNSRDELQEDLTSDHENVLVSKPQSSDSNNNSIDVEETVNEQDDNKSLTEKEKEQISTISFEPLMDYSAEFVKKEVNDIKLDSTEEITEMKLESIQQPKTQQISFEDLLGYQAEEPQFEKKSDNVKPSTLNEKMAKNTTIGLNDRIGFIKFLFDGSEEDFNRVLSQTGTLDNADEVKDFIDKLVKPDYNNWENKDEYEARFMEVILSRFL